MYSNRKAKSAFFTVQKMFNENSLSNETIIAGIVVRTLIILAFVVWVFARKKLNPCKKGCIIEKQDLDNLDDDELRQFVII